MTIRSQFSFFYVVSVWLCLYYVNVFGNTKYLPQQRCVGYPVATYSSCRANYYCAGLLSRPVLLFRHCGRRTLHWNIGHFTHFITIKDSYLWILSYSDLYMFQGTSPKAKAQDKVLDNCSFCLAVSVLILLLTPLH